MECQQKRQFVHAFRQRFALRLNMCAILSGDGLLRDAGGYYCCEPAQGAKTKCGTNRWTYQAGCDFYCSGVTNCRVTLMNGGCYRPS